MFEISTLKEKKISELQKIASDLGIEKISGLKKQDLAYKIIDHYASKPELKEKDSKPQAKSDESEKSDINKLDKNNNRNNSNKFVKKEKNHNKDNRNRYKEPDFEFDGIIESEGVLDIMHE